VTPSERGRNVRQRPGVVGNAMASVATMMAAVNESSSATTIRCRSKA
jgi:hypothetical protein